ncbi:Dual specificity phosphatase catalytic domain [Phytophthora infestans]|uniref:Dual specificity phosphatase catalytic domain n=1 Tax=Phytophthora infestans TaxID=4787 RepID=A0A833S8T2_PHYIN|nr:Dual specificity phosphatase catalytic domain [Phytophthora infestans]KAF4143514.1 Dual specificity phosphatase catalytic domain-containing protein [Phytophthora infestans]
MSSKIKDGLFMGDMDAAQDADFLQLNGIMHIINCVPRQVPNIFQQSLGLSYTVCDLEDVLRRPFFNLKNREFTQIIQLIDRALERTESVLVHSLNGTNRSPSIMIGYLMVRYCWGLDKAHEFVMTKRADMKLHESYIDQLCSLEAQVQEDRPARATERQLYEWSTHAADPTTDEVVLIHTFLNTAATPDANTAPERRRDTSKRHRERRLTWIDQTPEMRKLHPSLLVRPERPPNNSYNKMTAANGWVDLLDPSPVLAHQAKIKEIPPQEVLRSARVAFADLSTSGLSSKLDALSSSRYVDEPEFDLGGPEAPLHVVHSIKRLHSFSAPKRTVVLDDEVSSSPSTASEELDFMPEVSNPRYLRGTVSSTNSRPRRLSSTVPTASKRSTTSTKRSSLPTNGRSYDTKTSKGTAKKTTKTTTASNTRTASTTTSRGRVFFSADFPPPSSSTTRTRNGHILTGSTRLSTTDPLSHASAPTRPRTAPPRIRTDVETKDLLQSKKVELGGFSRITIDPKTSYRMHSSLDFTNGIGMDANVSSSSSTRGTRRTSASNATGYGRPKTARASWR